MQSDTVVLEYLQLLEAKKNLPKRTPLEHQKLPGTDWSIGALIGGRGTGKTATGAMYVDQHVHGEPCMNGSLPHRILIIAPTIGAAADSCFYSPAGLRAVNATARLQSKVGGTYVTWDNGSMAKLVGAQTVTDIEQIRPAGNTCLVWIEEWAACRLMSECFDQAQFGLRIGKSPKMIITTTPKYREPLKRLFEDAKTNPNIVIKHGTIDDNPFLEQKVKDALKRRYQGTRLEKQELLGIMTGDVEGALWTTENIARNRVTELPAFQEIVVAIDPAVTVSESSDETGIIVCAKSFENYGYVLEDASGKYLPHEWAKIALKLYKHWKADWIIAEDNNGGMMVEETIKVLDNNAPIQRVNASRGKRTRAEPISVAYRANLVKHYGIFESLEEQLVTWTPDLPDSPDRLDALVWGLTKLGFGVGDFIDLYSNLDTVESDWYSFNKEDNATKEKLGTYEDTTDTGEDWASAYG